MHREFQLHETPLAGRSATSLYLVTIVVVALVVADLWQPIATWFRILGLDLPTLGTREFRGIRFAQLAAAIGAARTLFSSLEGIFEGRIGADFAVFLACIAAVFMGEPLIAAEVIVIGLIGECLEAITFDRTQRAVRKLTELFPQRCWVLRDGSEVRTLVADVIVGDQVVVKPGGKIPVDGVVVLGESALDTAALTGESLPREVRVGDKVLAGSVNQLGSLTILAKQVAKQTIAGQVIELTANALRDKAPVERYADKLARRFLPLVLIAAVVVFFVNWGLQAFGTNAAGNRPSVGAAARVALYPTLAVLVVACPCPLVLATPAAMIAALGRLAGTGILIKGSAVIERLAEVKAIAFDKTGTLTEGKLSVGDVVPIECNREELLQVAALAEQSSEHPIAKAIVEHARTLTESLPPATLEAFAAVPGAGVSVRIDGDAVHVGTPRFLAQQGITVLPEFIHALENTGQSLVAVAKGGRFRGLIGVRDTLRPEAIGVLDELAKSGLNLSLLTGDREVVAQQIAKDLPFSAIHAEQLPTDKAERIGEATAFIGDGINDAPALAKASVGLAVGTGSDIAADASDVVLMGEPLRSIPLLLRLSRATITIIRQNIIWFGFGINLVGVVLTGLLWPIFASSPDVYEKAPLVGVLYHQLGSLLVLLNSMRLLVFERTTTNSTLLGVRDAYRWFDQRYGGASFDDVLHDISHEFPRILRWGSVVVIVAWLFSGLTQINSNEVGVVQRFGAVRDELAPGLHLRWPTFVERVTKVRPNEVRLVTVGFRYRSDEQTTLLALVKEEQQKLAKASSGGRDLSWSSAHGAELAPLTDESLMITGDGNLVDVMGTVRYTISDTRLYLFGNRDVDSMIRSHAETVFRELVAGSNFADLLTTQRSSFEVAAHTRLNARITDPSLGVVLEGVTVHDLHPPQEVVKEYHAVAQAIQQRDRIVNEAEADSLRLKRRAEEDALRVVRAAESDATKKLADAKASRESFLEWHKLRTQLTVEETQAMANELADRVAKGADRSAVERELQHRRDAVLLVRRTLSEFRLSLAAMTSVLAGRDKIFIDAQDLPGRRQLLLTDPDALRLLPPQAPKAAEPPP